MASIFYQYSKIPHGYQSIPSGQQPKEPQYYSNRLHKKVIRVHLLPIRKLTDRRNHDTLNVHKTQLAISTKRDDIHHFQRPHKTETQEKRGRPLQLFSTGRAWAGQIAGETARTSGRSCSCSCSSARKSCPRRSSASSPNRPSIAASAALSGTVWAARGITGRNLFDQYGTCFGLQLCDDDRRIRVTVTE